MSRRVLAKLYRAFGVAAVVVLAGCTMDGYRSPVTDLGAGSSATYTVRPGDTLSSISRQTGVSVEGLQTLNDISNPSLIRVGQRLRLGTGSAMAGASDSGAMPPVPETVTRAADANRLNMIWPTKGKVTHGFTTETKGIDIVGEVGQAVNASAAGKVVYAGNGVRGLGNLVIVDHGGGFITAYAHNEKLMVKAGDAVTKGGQVATLGQSDTTSPRLHFEVRRNGTPVDPLRYLPESQS